ncbi:hypothetical protein F2Q70_00005041 [Brassica cretica]|uniref:Ubiquitin-like protease family profile domain-containing protein n=1 Tax=Brassica cretica TaxID=69181 RepID=A0A8S9IUD8_BRACR|nr:hypothetical protein F2Q70_00005041 [Brassica cretica]
MARGIYERLKTMERNICSHLGVSPPNVHNTLKMKADDDNHGLSDSPKTVGIQKQWPPRKSRRASSTVTKPTKKIHCYPLRSADGLQNSQGNIGCTPPYFNKESGADYDCAHDRTPPFDEHVNYQEPRTPYAVPDESNSENPVTTVTVYNPLIFVRPQSYVSPTKEEEKYESCKENISIDSQLQEEQPGAVETLPGSDTDEDDNSVESGGKRLRKKSQKICGVDTPDARLNGLFMSEKKTEYMPLPKISRAIFKKQIQIKTSHIVTNCFFLDIATPGKWLSDEMTPVLKSLPYILEQYVGYTVYQISEGVRFYSWNRVEGIYHNKRGGDCAPCAAEFMEMHSNGDGKEEMRLITDKVVDKFREQYVMDCYEEFVGDYRVANEASMK